MRTTRKNILFAIVLIAAIAMAGNASAGKPVLGWVNSTVADGNMLMLYVEGGPAGDYVTCTVGDADPQDIYQFSDIDPLLNRAGVLPGGTYSATVEMRCSGVERDEYDAIGNPYTNTLRNTTPTTAYIVNGIRNTNTDFVSLMEVESCVSGETFSKDLYEGWNLISLPLTPGTDSASSVLASVWANVTAVYRYNATSKQFESTDVMDIGIGYYVHATSECTWEYSGTAYTSVDVLLKQGLNMAGWLNCSKDIDDALSSISGDYYYVARWNTTAEKFEVYNPAAPSALFNDFTTMERGTGYFISAKQECTLFESC